MNSLDSRFLRLGDCYARRFTDAGVVPYELSRLPFSPATHDDAREPALAITVRDAPGERKDKRQHNVVVREVKGRLLAEPALLEVAVGDGVLWAADKTVATGFRIRSLDAKAFDSANLTGGSLFTHAFGLAGRYEWRDANGSSLCGEVLVTMPGGSEQDRAAWQATLSQGTIIHVNGERATPDTVELMVGQTVFWAIETAPGVSITDVVLLGGGNDDSP